MVFARGIVYYLNKVYEYNTSMLQTPMSLSFPEQDFTPLLEKENKIFEKLFFQRCCFTDN